MTAPTQGARSAALAGTGLLADDLCLMAHDDVSGRSLLQPRAGGLGVAGGLLAEQMLAGRITIWHGRVVAAGPGPAPDELGRRVLDLVCRERERHLVRDWLAFIGRTAVADVAVRLERAGYLAPAQKHGLRRGVRWVPVDPDCAFAPLARARPALVAAGTATSYSIVLAGLAVACGLGPRLLPCGPAGGRQHLELAVGKLPPGTRELIAQVQAAVDAAVLTQRT